MCVRAPVWGAAGGGVPGGGGACRGARLACNVPKFECLHACGDRGRAPMMGGGSRADPLAGECNPTSAAHRPTGRASAAAQKAASEAARRGRRGGDVVGGERRMLSRWE